LPGCGTEGVLLDNLTPDDEAVSNIKAYEAEMADAKKEKEKQPAGQDGLFANEGSDAAPQGSQYPKSHSPPKPLRVRRPIEEETSRG